MTMTGMAALWKRAAKVHRKAAQHHWRSAYRLAKTAGTLQWHLFDDRIRYNKELATLSAERDEAVAMCKALQDTLSGLLSEYKAGGAYWEQTEDAAWSVVERTEEYLRRYDD